MGPQETLSPPSEDNAEIKAVYTKDGTTFKTILRNGQYKVLETGQIELPDGFYSSGYWERQTGGVWSELPDWTHGEIIVE